MKKEFHHVGIPTQIRQPNEIHLAPSKLFITDATQSGMMWRRTIRHGEAPINRTAAM